MTEKPLVSIIIPALNEEKNIGQCLEAIKHLDFHKENLEVIVVDNGSSDKTVEIAKLLGAQVVIKADASIASLRNLGAGIAQGDVLAFVDADCVVARFWLAEALRELENRDVGAAGSNMQLGKQGTWVSQAWEFKKIGKNKRREVDWIQSGNLIIKRKCFEDVGGFDNRLNVCEDSDICYRIKSSGYKVISNPAICSYHLGFTNTLRSFFIKELWHGKDILRVFCISKNRKKYIKMLGLAIFFATAILFSLISVTLGRFADAFSMFIILIFFSFASSAQLCFERSDFRHLIPLTILTLTFGIARSVSILDVRNWRR